MRSGRLLKINSLVIKYMWSIVCVSKIDKTKLQWIMHVPSTNSIGNSVNWSNKYQDYTAKTSTSGTYREPKLLHYSRILSCCKSGVLLTLGSCAYHFAWGEDEGCRPRFSNTHDDCGKSLGIIFCITSVECNFLQLQLAAEVHCWHNVPEIMRKVRDRGKHGPTGVIYWGHCS